MSHQPIPKALTPGQAEATVRSTVRRARDTDARGVVALLSSEHDLEVAFDPAQFWVADVDGLLAACARLRPLGPDAWELASVVVRSELRGRGIGQRVVQAALADVRGVVHALALAPSFFASLGFAARADVPEVLGGKATSICASADFVPMELVR